MSSARLQVVLSISAFFFGIVVSLRLPVARTSFLWSTLVVGEILFGAGVLMAAVGAGYSVRNRRAAKRSITEGFAWLREIVAESARSDLVLWGLIVNWVGALMYPVLLVPISLVTVSGRYGAGVAGILIIDIALTFALRIPLLRHILRERNAAITISSERGASV